ncbi:MAG TPA: DUF4337 family protein [Caulobacteraceae bacterium]|jgi:hypothetical protein|nr:DUF4337 family protein [Caulobacteraceae bacterium]
MADSPLEELEAHEHAEHAAHAAHPGANPLIGQVTLTIAVLAVAAAVVASLETTEGDRTIVAKNDAVLQQNRATDEWNFFQAKSLKKNLYVLAADQAGPKATAYAKVAAKNAAEEAGIQTQAKSLEAKRDAAGETAERHEWRHERLTIASTLLHMSIAIATLAIILTRRWPWVVSLVLAAAGSLLAVWVYL